MSEIGKWEGCWVVVSSRVCLPYSTPERARAGLEAQAILAGRARLVGPSGEDLGECLDTEDSDAGDLEANRDRMLAVWARAVRRLGGEL